MKHSQPNRRLLLALLTLALVLAVSGTSLADAQVPYPLRSAIILRAVGYEKGFAGRSGEAVIAVVVGSSGESQKDGQAMAGVLAALAKKTKVGGGRPAKVVQITHSSVDDTASKLSAVKAEVVYVARDLEALADKIPTSQGSTRRIIACSHGSRVQGGCVLGVELAGEKPRLVINLKQANSIGLRFQPELLRLARIVR